MNKKGFTLVELLATLVILGIVMGIVLISTTGGFGKAKDKTEDVFIKTIEDALNIYLDSDAKRLSFTNQCANGINKSHKVGVKVFKTTINFNDVINSTYSPITVREMHNPANKGKDNYQCTNLDNVIINIYRDEDFVYYYEVDKSQFNCLNGEGVITNLPSGYGC